MQNTKLKKDAPFFWLRGIFLFVLLIIVDQLAKYKAGPIFKNAAFAFSLPIPIKLIYFIYAVVIVGMFYYVAKNFKTFSLAAWFSWVLIFAGAASNILERIYLGYVRDFIYITFYKWTGVYNIADGYIIAGVILLVLNSSRVIDKNNKNEQK